MTTPDEPPQEKPDATPASEGSPANETEGGSTTDSPPEADDAHITRKAPPAAPEPAGGATPAGNAEKPAAAGTTADRPEGNAGPNTPAGPDTAATPDGGAGTAAPKPEAGPEPATDGDANAPVGPGAEAPAASDGASARKAGPEGVPAEAGPGAGAATPLIPHPRHRRRHWLRILAACTAFLVLALGAGGWYVYRQLNGNITTDTTTETELKAHDKERPAEGPTKAENILLIGSDNRGNGNEQYGHDTGTQRSDTTILLHLAADRSSATAVSIPRDLMAHVPDCTKPDGGTAPARFEQFNWAFQFGGAACTIRTVEDMTGIRIDHHLIVDFTGFKKMVDAVNGVEVCVPEPVHDVNAQLDLPAGRQKLNGSQALGYVRARESIGDGSDTQRMERQQDFLASLVSKVRSNGVLLNPVKLYPLLSAATSSLTADPGLDSLSELYDLAHSIQQTPTGAIRFLTLPREPYVADHNRDQLMQPAADQLFTAIRDDVAVNVTGETPDGSSTASPTANATGTPTGTSTGTPTGTPTRTPTGTSTGTPTATPTDTASGTPSAVPTYRGTTADRDLCSKDQ
ncbi:LCP family protein [Streptomyces sp. NBC_01476]|uniref:LCP family protein n=1 Tax=Streptomyces sp. NBC_01476 TaxID=2903881 RepID=UPI002E331D3B|nr:LCP family protein [Streptomyces sp. NBC_01476]